MSCFIGSMGPMTSSATPSTWQDFRAAEPAFEDTVRTRFQQYRHHVLATLRADGSPRVTGLEVEFRMDALWFGMMPNSRKALDLRCDPRFAVQANPGPDAEMADGDVRVSGRAVEVTDPAVLARFIAEVTPPEPFLLFRADPAEVVRTGLDGDDLVIRVWRPGHSLRTLRRAADDSPVREA
ncbi:pyridoxamine 5'-phosphate oxidase family protein [Mesorhizobium sp. B2-3-3]|nr:pyridoxamine 5'-phosphate oxidase [Streptomyces avidinii]TPM96077.1 pyridoxamine 5'-phosphate oxidase family protein [Mesorhizobium sp. B2-3-3]SNX73369.1 Pyridoxamine 5'-phosphate oxidase [Streptomyces microflavus]